MDQLKSTVTTSMNVRVDVPTKARATRIQRITGKSLPQLLERMFRVWEERYVLACLDAEARELYFTGALSVDGFRERQNRPIDCPVAFVAGEDDTTRSTGSAI